ncbi:MAG: hypothetical protein ACI32O_05335 [Enterococcus sp.]
MVEKYFYENEHVKQQWESEPLVYFQHLNRNNKKVCELIVLEAKLNSKHQPNQSKNEIDFSSLSREPRV